MKQATIYITIIIILFVAIDRYQHYSPKDLPLIAIANYGPHETLISTIHGLKKQMEQEGFVESDVSFQL